MISDASVEEAAAVVLEAVGGEICLWIEKLEYLEADPISGREVPYFHFVQAFRVYQKDCRFRSFGPLDVVDRVANKFEAEDAGVKGYCLGY